MVYLCYLAFIRLVIYTPYDIYSGEQQEDAVPEMRTETDGMPSVKNLLSKFKVLQQEETPPQGGTGVRRVSYTIFCLVFFVKEWLELYCPTLQHICKVLDRS